MCDRGEGAPGPGGAPRRRGGAGPAAGGAEGGARDAPRSMPSRSSSSLTPHLKSFKIR